MLPTEAWCFTRESGSDARFLDIFDGTAGGEPVERVEVGCDGRIVTEAKLKNFIQVKENKLQSVEERPLNRSSPYDVPHTAASPIRLYYFVHARRTASCLGALCDKIPLTSHTHTHTERERDAPNG